jgi:hypothetical protein
LDPFNTCDLENTEGIVNIQKINEEIQEFDPFANMFSNEKKKEDIEVDDYNILDVKRNILYIKSSDNVKKKTNLMPIKDFIKNDKNNNDENKTNLEKETDKDDKKDLKNSFEDDTTGKDDNQENIPKKIIGRNKIIPLKIEEDYFIIK